MKILQKKSILLFICAFLVYANSLKNGFVLDDDVVFVQNRFVQEGFSGIDDIFSHGFLYGFNQKNDQSYRPLVLANFAIEKAIFGNNPKAHHFINILLYAVLCVLLFTLLNTLFKNYKVSYLFWIALLYALHPIHTEVVANIKGRDEILHAIFYFLTIYQSFLYLDNKKVKNLLLSCLYFFLAALSKEMAITLLAILPISWYIFRERPIKEYGQMGVYFLVPTLVYFLLRFSILDTIAFEEKMSVINNGITAASNQADQFATTLVIFMNYLKLLLIPFPLAWDYSYPHFPVAHLQDGKAILSLVFILGSLFAGFYGFIKRKKFAFWILFFFISFSIVSNFFILIGSTLGERFMFLPSIGFIGILVSSVVYLVEQLKFKLADKTKIISVLMISLSVFYSYHTFERNKDWESNETLFTAGIMATPNNARAVSAYASIFRARAESSSQPSSRNSDFTESVKWYKKSLKLFPDNPDASYNLGVAYMGLNEDGLAKNAFEHTISVQENHLSALNNLGVIYFREQNYPRAEEYFKQCLRVNIGFSNAYANLGAIYHNLGDLRKAKTYYEEALRINPNDINTRNNYQRIK